MTLSRSLLALCALYAGTNALKFGIICDAHQSPLYDATTSANKCWGNSVLSSSKDEIKALFGRM